MSYASVSTHAARSRALASLENLRASSHRAWEALGSRSLMVLPMPLPPDVANKAIRADEKSHASKNVLMMFGAVYHKMGKPISTVSYASIPFRHRLQGRPARRVLALASAPGPIEVGGGIRLPGRDLEYVRPNRIGKPARHGLGHAACGKIRYQCFPDIALSLAYRNSVRAKRAYALERARPQGPVLDFRHSWPIVIMDEEKAMLFLCPRLP